MGLFRSKSSPAVPPLLHWSTAVQDTEWLNWWCCPFPIPMDLLSPRSLPGYRQEASEGAKHHVELRSAMRKRKMVCRTHWPLVFLAASILSSSFLLTQVQSSPINFPIKLHPEFPIEGQDLYLIPLNIWPDYVSCNWYRNNSAVPQSLIFSYELTPTNRTINGSAFTGRESLGSDCQVYIRNLRLEDAGDYFMTMNTTSQYGEGYTRVVIAENLQSPFLESAPKNGIVAENSSESLYCHTSNQSDVEVFWFKDGKPLLPSMGVLSNQNRTLTLSHVGKNATGTYSCTVKNFISHLRSNPVQVLVTYGPQVALIPEGTIYKTLYSDLAVECVAESIPEATLQWFFNGVKQKETGNIFLKRFNDMNSAGSFTCRATNPFTNVSVERTGYVILTKGIQLTGSAIAGIVIGCVAGVALVAGLLYFIKAKTSIRRNQPPATIGHVPTQRPHKAVPAVSMKSAPLLSRSLSHTSRGSRSPSGFSLKEVIR